MSAAGLAILLLMALMAPLPLCQAQTPLDIVKLSGQANLSVIKISGLDGSAAKAIAKLNPAIGSGKYWYDWDILYRQNLTQAGQSRAVDQWMRLGTPPLRSVREL